MGCENDFNDEVFLALDHLIINENNVAFFLQVLKETNNVDFWLVLPLELAKTHNPQLPLILVDLLQDSRTINHRGNFLSALEEYDYFQYYKLLMNLACDDNWEVRTKAALMILKIKDRIPLEELNVFKEVISRELNMTKKKYEFFCDLCEDLEFDL